MAVKKNFLDRFSERFDDLDSGSRQAYILRLAKDKGFLETVFNSIEEGVLVVDQNLHPITSNCICLVYTVITVLSIYFLTYHL